MFTTIALSHDLSTWTTTDLELRAMALETWPADKRDAITGFDPRCGCDETGRCVLNDVDKLLEAAQ